jgi:molybdenum cofactor biosynthesis protein B
MAAHKKAARHGPAHAHHPHHDHSGAGASARCAVITVSDSRDAGTDRSGDAAEQLLATAGHAVRHREIIPDDLEKIWSRAGVLAYGGSFDLILLTGGTGVSRRDVTPEAIRPLLDKELPGFGELFRRLSHEEIGAAAALSRALAGIVNGRLLVALPGSPAAVRLGLEKILLPELGHFLFELRKHAPDDAPDHQHKPVKRSAKIPDAAAHSRKPSRRPR